MPPILKYRFAVPEVYFLFFRVYNYTENHILESVEVKA